MITIFLCIADCDYTPWCEWSKCDAECGQFGKRTRTKTLIIDESFESDLFCLREIIETRPCTGKPCSCVYGVNCTCDLTKWSDWSECSLPCGGGQRERTRQYKTNTAENCPPKNLRETQPCNVKCCPIDGRYTPWSQWSTCSVTCGSGIRKRQRTCTDPKPSCNGKSCRGCAVDTQVCNTQPCG